MLTPEMIEGIYDYIGSRIRSERVDAGVSQDELGLRVGLTRTSISNIELGRQKVQIHTLYYIASVLGVPPSSLLPPLPDQAEVEEKYLKKLSLGEREWVKSILGALPGRGESERGAAIKADIAKDPERLLQQIGVSAPPVPVDQVARKCGAEIRYAPYEGQMSGLLFRGAGQTVIGLNSLDSKVRQRFAVAHELGHLALHGDRELHVDRTFSAVRGAGTPAKLAPEEGEANDFASRLLIPADMLKADLKGRPADFLDSDAVEGLADRYKVGMSVMAYRLITWGDAHGRERRPPSTSG